MEGGGGGGGTPGYYCQVLYTTVTCTCMYFVVWERFCPSARCRYLASFSKRSYDSFLFFPQPLKMVGFVAFVDKSKSESDSVSTCTTLEHNVI